MEGWRSQQPRAHVSTRARRQKDTDEVRCASTACVGWMEEDEEGEEEEEGGKRRSRRRLCNRRDRVVTLAAQRSELRSSLAPPPTSTRVAILANGSLCTANTSALVRMFFTSVVMFRTSVQVRRGDAAITHMDMCATVSL